MEILRTKLEALKELHKKVAEMSEKEEQIAEVKAMLLGVWCAFHVTVGIAYLVVGISVQC